MKLDMKTFEVTFHWTSTDTITVEAESEEEAIDKARDWADGTRDIEEDVEVKIIK